MVAPCTKLNPGGNGASRSAGTLRRVANVPDANPTTRSPTANCVTPSPTANTSPASSLPRAPIWTGTIPRASSTSRKLRPAACTRTCTWPGPGGAISSVSKCSPASVRSPPGTRRCVPPSGQCSRSAAAELRSRRGTQRPDGRSAIWSSSSGSRSSSARRSTQASGAAGSRSTRRHASSGCSRASTLPIPHRGDCASDPQSSSASACPPQVTSHTPARGNGVWRTNACTSDNTLPQLTSTSADSVSPVVDAVVAASTLQRCTTPRSGGAPAR